MNNKTRINLYSPTLLPPELKVNFKRLTLAVTVMLVVGFSLYIYTAWQARALESELKQLTVQKKDQEKEKTELETLLAQRKPDKQLVSKVERATQDKRLKSLLLTEIGLRDQLTSHGFSKVLTELATVADGNIWLSKIHFDEPKLEIEGYSAHPSSLPKWVNNLQQTESFKGRAFASMTMSSGEDKPLAFKLTTEGVGVGTKK